MKPKNSPTPETIELTIDSLSYAGGRGVGRVDGVVVFVAGTAPGDRVQARVVTRKARFLEAQLIKILTPSEARRVPPCPVAERCGGCSWQHVQYAEQVRQKEKILRDSLRRFSGIEWRPFVPARDEFHYRNRIQLQIDQGRLGFFAKGTRDLVTFAECWIAEKALNERLKTLNPKTFGDARKVELALDESAEVHVMHGPRDPDAALFSQVHTAQNTALKALVVEAVQGSPEWILDLYCGSGNLTFPLHEAWPKAALMAVELSRSAIVRAQKRSQSVDWRVGDVAKVLKGFSRPAGHGLAVLDPPRVGCDHAVLESLLRLQPQQIVYVSCNPSTFARDAERLQSLYRLEQVQGLDMFPQTEHCELVASFARLT